MTVDESLDNLLMRAGLTRTQIDDARGKSTNTAELGAQLEKTGAISQVRWAALLAERLGLAFSPVIDDEDAPADLVRRLSMQFCRKNKLLPLRLGADTLRVATADPLRLGPLDDLRVLYGREIEPVVVPDPALSEGINRAFDRAAGTGGLMEGFENDESLELGGGDLRVPDLLESDDEAPIIRLINQIIFQAAKDGASDIHIEPFETTSSVRYRVDGMLIEVLRPPRRIHAAMTSRIKVMASMDIAEKRLPQDGGIRTRVAGREVDIRCSTLPTAHGERVVMRLLDRSSTVLGLGQLGLSGANLENFRRLIVQSHGIILVTGPTGSGKTTTLYAALSEINSEEKNIITIEDPVEYQLPGIGQIQVNPKIELTFASGLRSILRQDPDVIMVGEIRDSDTARTAIQAALTGHLVLSTLHTNDSFSAASRLLDMGIEPFLVSSSLIGVLAQRLVRKLCLECSRPSGVAESGLAELGLGSMLGDNSRLRLRGEGCDNCRGTGYTGRTAIHELLVVDDTVRTAIMQHRDAVAIREAAVAHGTTTLRTDGTGKVRQGITSVEEILRATSEEAV